MDNENFYERLGSYFVSEDESQTADYVNNNINSKLFNRLRIKIEIEIIGTSDPTGEQVSTYRISKIHVAKKDRTLEKDKNINAFISDIEDINKNLQESNNFYNYKAGKNGWTIFFLLKELITTCQNLHYNYFRGQAKNWPIMPSIFRNKTNKYGKYIYEEFERDYKDICREFPDNLKYIPLEKEYIGKRADELAVLQHYGFPTSLIDITDNPFIALMFMSCFEKMDNPCLICYRINSDESLNNSLVSLVDKLDVNKRIKAQRGAFLNYDKLSYLFDFQKNMLVPKNIYCPIDMITFEICLSEVGIDDSNKESKERKEHYELLRNELVRKLNEFGYYPSHLFPDFDDYIKYKSEEFKLNSQKIAHIPNNIDKIMDQDK
ncbi:FRG domain-containing protein [Lactobacillus amylovorus]|uniref:FRG domain-containing protein n=1 Tax=Lactobacillus amylovorus TaxID=1604 RepID=UPI0023314141|nr:FRG domain-containing protein [Lactobacillus amylovorus]MDB6256238.1 FRG domain-containing protein [Lactobacillus amylovorus]